VVAVEFEMVVPVDDPSEPCYESETVHLLREIREHAERGDVTWLTKKGKVYAVPSAATNYRTSQSMMKHGCFRRSLSSIFISLTMRRRAVVLHWAARLLAHGRLLAAS